MRPILLCAALFGIAACSQREPDPVKTPEAPASPASPSPTAAGPSPAQALAIPDRFHGIWDYVEGSCDPASDMRTEIAERGITFYESHGAVTGLKVESPTRITVTLAMQGEGEKWTMTRTFTLSEDGAILTPTGGGDTGEPMPLKRCA